MFFSLIVVGPNVDIMTPSEPPMIGEAYSSKCTGTAPPNVQGVVTVTWVDEDGSVIVGNSSMEMACATLTFDPFLLENAQVYRCQVSIQLYFSLAAFD